MPQDLVITPNKGSTTSGAQIAFTGYSGASSIYLKVLPDSSLSFEGSAGQLFSITDNLSSGTIFSVNDITGIPSFDVNANGLVRIAPYGGNVALGTTATSGRLQINTGSATTIGQIIQAASGQTANYTEWRNSSGAIVNSINSSGFLGIGTSSQTRSAIIATNGATPQLNIYKSPDGTLNTAQLCAAIGTGSSSTNAGTGGGNEYGLMQLWHNNTTRVQLYAGNATDGNWILDPLGIGTTGSQSGQLRIGIGTATRVGIVVVGATSQTANLTEWQNSAGSNVASMNASGALIASYAGFGGAIPSGSYRLDVSGLANLGGIVFDGGTCSFPSLSAGSYPTSLYINNTTKGHGIRVDKNQGGDVESSIAAFYASVTNTYSNNPVGFFAVSNSAGCKPMIARGSASQTANLQEWQNSAGSVIARINASGEFFGLLASGIVTSGEIGNAAVVSGSIASGQIGSYHFGATGLASGRTLSTDGTGILSWATGGGGGLTVSDDTSTNATRYLTFTSATTGSVSTINVSSTKLSFNPSTGDFTAGGNITANSDARIKTNIKTIENALDKVKSLRGVSFERKDSGIKNIGVIAQEVEAIVPELVRESDGLKSVAYGNIVALLIEAIKEQSKKIEELEKLCQSISNPS